MFGVCCRILGNETDAEDAFQAALLVALRKFRTVRARESLGGWLHTMVTRVALRSRKQRASAKQREQEALAVRNQLGSLPASHELWTQDLDSALAELPEQHRLPLTLCYLSGKTGDEAAAELGCSRSTLTRRLTEGRELLRKRLERLGVVIPAAALLVVLNEASAAEPPATAIAAVTSQGAVGASPAALSLAEGFMATGSGLMKWVLVGILSAAVMGLVGWACGRSSHQRSCPHR